MIAGIAITLLALGGACGIVRLLLGPTLADRVIALDVVLVAAMGAIAVFAASGGSTANLAILSVIAIVAFTVTVVTSRHIETRSEAAPATGIGRRPVDDDPSREIRGGGKP